MAIAKERLKQIIDSVQRLSVRVEAGEIYGNNWLKENRPQAPEYWHERKWKCPNAPVVGVSWYEADAFCRWLTQRCCRYVRQCVGVDQLGIRVQDESL